MLPLFRASTLRLVQASNVKDILSLCISLSCWTCHRRLFRIPPLVLAASLARKFFLRLPHCKLFCVRIPHFCPLSSDTGKATAALFKAAWKMLLGCLRLQAFDTQQCKHISRESTFRHTTFLILADHPIVTCLGYRLCYFFVLHYVYVT